MAELRDRLAFHEGELAAQREAGLTAEAERVRPIIGATVPRGARTFLRQRRLLALGARDPRGRVWATALLGPEGFLSAEDPATLRVDAAVSAVDPLAAVLRGEAEVGTLVIDLAGRRRLRVNGRWRPTASGGEVAVHQAFGNCPQYIHPREVPAREQATAPVATRSTALDARAAALVAGADTFFVATAAAGGTDVSHRGGRPGFVRVTSPTELSWPDYVGNAMLMTVGNLRLDPSAGLYLPDWRTGAALHLTGRARVRTTEPGPGPATGRETVFRVDEAVWVDGALPAGWDG